MKVLAARPVDRPDLVALWPQCKFASPEEALLAFSAAYPDAPDDEFLVDWLRRIAEDAARDRR